MAKGQEGQWTPDLLKLHYDERMAVLEHRLDGFPQEYVSETEGDELRKTLETIRSDHVQRREVAQMRDSIEQLRADYVTRREVDDIKRALDQAAGRRTTWGIAAGIVVAALTLLYGASYRSQLTHADISQQIQQEAPSHEDLAQIAVRLARVEREDQQLSDRIAALLVRSQVRSSGK